MSEDVFYKDGLKFQCVRCSRCCRYEPGYVFLSMSDIQNLVKHLKITQEDFIHKFCREINFSGFKRLSLKEKSNYDCIFWEDGGCAVYKARPLQCRTYPFWEEYLLSQENWDDLEKSCPGVNHGRLYTYDEIEAIRKKRLGEPPLIL
ncbi:YkgJ family cysteine cluster protein [Spirochaetia bacterium 38H-sp]|uniref:YkgJ family cysteine cluster protein n=1 Tax=Rarispira pelagica TaxID=3141764 RepID=A0ABU9UAQ0_9SPIR